MREKAGPLIYGLSSPSPGEGWKSTGKVFVVAVIIDAVYQYIVLRWFYPLEALLVAAVLAFVPYLIIRGPVNRIARYKKTIP